MADWTANAICEADMKQDEDIKGIRNHIFSFAKEMGFEKYIGYDKDIGYYADFELDDEPSIRSLIERYDEHSFWDELVDRLGERDFMKKYTREQRKAMTDEEHFSKRMECEESWGKELEENGVGRLRVDEKSEGV